MLAHSLGRTGCRGTKDVMRTGLILFSAVLSMVGSVLKELFSHMDLKMANGAHVIFTARDPKDRSMPLSAFPTKLSGTTSVVLVWVI